MVHTERSDLLYKCFGVILLFSGFGLLPSLFKKKGKSYDNTLKDGKMASQKPTDISDFPRVYLPSSVFSVRNLLILSACWSFGLNPTEMHVHWKSIKKAELPKFHPSAARPSSMGNYRPPPPPQEGLGITARTTPSF
jgi:hypothetical protein